MIPLDPTLALSSAAILTVGIGGLLMTVTSFFQSDTLAERQWIITYISGVICLVTMLFISPSQYAAVWAIVGNSTFVLVVGTIWTGLRAFNGRGPLTWLVFVFAAIAAIMPIVEPADVNSWFSFTSTHALTGIFLILGAFEAARALAGASFSGKLLGTTLAFAGIVEVARAASASIPAVPRVAQISPELVALVSIVFASFVTPLLLSLHRTVATHSSWISIGVTETGILPIEGFMLVGRDRLKRARAKNESVVLVSCSIENLDEIATAFSPTIRDENLEQVARVLAATAPTLAQISFVESQNRFLVLWVPPSDASVQRVISQVRTAIVEHSLDSVFVLNATVDFAQAWSRQYDYDLDAMIKATEPSAESDASDAGVDRAVPNL